MLTQKIESEIDQSILVTGVPESDEEAYEEAGSKYGVTPVIINELRRTPSLLDEIVAFIKVAKLIKKVKPDIVHTHHAKAGTLGRIAAKILGVHIRIHTYHGHVLSGYFSTLVSRIVVLTERALAKLSTSIVTISKEQYDDIVFRFKIAKTNITTIIPLGFDFSKMVNPTSPKGYWRDKLGISNSTICIGFVGRLAPIKNTSLLADAFMEFKKLHQNSSLWVIGDGPDKEILASRISSYNLQKDVQFLGWQTELSDIYQDLDVVILTSKNEGTPVALIEALAHGVPVVSTNVGGIKSILSLPDMGCAIDSFDPVIFAESIDSVVTTHKQDKNHQGEWYSEMFNRYGSDRLVAEIKYLYKSLS